MPTQLPILEVKLTFNDGGHDAFREKFQVMKERLDYARQLRRETGQDIPTGEDLPRYEEAREASSSSSNNPAAAAAAASATAGQSSGAGPSTASQATPSQPTPDEPPPDYEEAQAQALDIRLEEQMREEAERR